MAKNKRNITDVDREAAANLRNLFAAYKKKNSVSQAFVAGKLGMSQPGFSQYLRGQLPFGTDAVLKFAKFFNVKPEEIRGDREFPPLDAHQTAPRYDLGLSEDALEIARAFDKLPRHRQAVVREYVFLEAVIAKRMPWLIRGRPQSQSYDEFERTVLRDYHRAAIKEVEKQ